MKSKQLGPWFQNQVRQACEENRRRNGMFYHRLQDTTAAGNYLPNQPADFLVAFSGRAYLVECKASEIFVSLSECVAGMVKFDQSAYHQWWADCNLPSVFLFYSEPLGYVEAWVGEQVAEARRKNRPLGKTAAGCPIELLDENLKLLLEV